MSFENGPGYDEQVNKNTAATRRSIKKGSKVGDSEHYNPTVRLLKIEKCSSDARGFGFHLTRSKWDPYPWVSAVDATTPAELSGLKAGDCILEVNGEDVLGLRIKNIAQLVKAKSENVMLLLWSTGMDANCDPESLCCGPMPRSLQRLSVIMQNILSIIECPVCLDTIPPPAMQCQNGHILCVNCRIRAEKCPVCRDRYTPRRALIAEQIYNAITNALNLCNNEDKLRQKLFGPNAKPLRAQEEMAGQKKLQNGSKANQHDAESTSSPSTMPRNKFLAKLWGKACSMDNLASSSNMLSNGHALSVGTSTPALLVATAEAAAAPASTTATTKFHSTTNQLLERSYASNHVTPTVEKWKTGSSNMLVAATTSSCFTPPKSLSSTPSTASRVTRNNILQANSTLKHFSLSTNDLSLDGAQIAIQRCPSMQRLSSSRCQTNIAAPKDGSIGRHGDGDGDGNFVKTLSPLLLHSRRPCSSLSSSVECIQNYLRAIDTTVELNMNSTSSPLTSKSSSSSPSSSSSTATSLQLKSSGCDIKNDLLTFPSATTAPSSSSLSSTSSFSLPPSTKSSLSASPVLPASTRASDTQNAASDIPVAAFTPPLMTFGDNLTDYHLLKPVDDAELTSRNELLKNRFCCPFNCGKRFVASPKLHRHIRVDHQMPILCFGGTRAKLALPLQRPLDDSVLLLEIENDEILDGNVEGNQDADADDKHVRNDDKRRSKECWIRLKTTRKKDSNGCRIYASALMQGSDDECIDFMLETEVSCQQLDGGEEITETKKEKTKNDSKNGGIDENKELRPQQQQQQQPLLTRSIVHSMETTTWHELLSSSADNNNNNNGNAQTSFNSNDEKIKNPTNKNNDAEHCVNGKASLSSRRNPNDLSVISVIFQNDQNGVQNGEGSETAEMVLNIKVRRTYAK